ncbi:MAG: helix-turn-helix domain-containing protein [Sphingobacteriaceae bacterium]|nr:helix-turn-helix domain-containing protein [Sphingobacteriaceae bacterium]
MEEITKDDLRQLRMLIVDDIEKLLDQKLTVKLEKDQQEWLRSKAVRHILNISPTTLQNLRISGNLRFQKIMGSYYYNRTDLLKLFGDGKK